MSRRDDLPPLGHWTDLLGMIVSFAIICFFAFGCEHDDHHSSSDAATSLSSAPPQVGTATAAPGGAAAADPLPPGSVAWCYGGFNGSRASHDPRCRISSLRVNNPSGLSLRWESGIPADWARTSGLVIVALFFQTGDGSWKGGKIDWIDTARSTRDLKNPASGYGGWNWAEYLAARKHALVVVSADGRKRSNWIFD